MSTSKNYEINYPDSNSPANIEDIGAAIIKIDSVLKIIDDNNKAEVDTINKKIDGIHVSTADDKLTPGRYYGTFDIGYKTYWTSITVIPFIDGVIQEAIQMVGENFVKYIRRVKIVDGVNTFYDWKEG